MRRKDREKDSAFALEVLRDCEYATLATVNPDGTPYCIPISPALTGNTIYFHCAPEGKKLENIAQNSNVCVSCVRHTKLVPEKFTTEFESAVAVGRCEMVQDDDEKIMALRLICEKYAADNLGEFDNAIHRSLSRTGIGRIEISNITGSQYLLKLNRRHSLWKTCFAINVSKPRKEPAVRCPAYAGRNPIPLMSRMD